MIFVSGRSSLLTKRRRIVWNIYSKMLSVLFLMLVTSIELSQSKGSCPPTLSVDKCDANCGPKLPCNLTQLCCPTVCGGAICVDAMTQRHFVNLVKKGRCPENPRGIWICSHTCTGDSDCPRSLKCCPNRCGALTCQRPELDEIPLLW